MATTNKKIFHFILLFIIAFIWGSSFILMKKGLLVFNEYEVALLRMSIAFISIFPFIWKKILKINKKHIIPILIVAFFGNGIPAFLFTKAQTQLDSSLVGILNALVPIFTFLISIYLFKNRLIIKQLLGIIIGLLGAITLIAFNGIYTNNISYSYFVIIATICYAISLNTIKYSLYDISAIDIAGFAFLTIGPICIFGLFFTEFFHKICYVKNSGTALFYIILLSTIGTSLALVWFNKLIKETNEIFASSVTYLIPIIAIIWGFIDGEIINWNHIICILIILSGIYLVNKE